MPPERADVDPGARVEGDAVTFTVWAPRHEWVTLRLDGRDIPMEPGCEGYFSITVPGARAGQRYFYKLKDGLRPDPASRYQPDGVFGPSAIVDPASFPWTDADWTGAPLRHRSVVYEMHVGTFTTGGTWSAARTHLQRLADLGVTTLEILPLAEFSGRFGWGYDGVFLFAPFHEYGSPDDIRVFVNDAHRLGIAVILDVVYNHLGPVGNVLHDFSDWYFAEHETDWGRGFNVDGEQSQAVRAFMRANVREWIGEYHFDGLRFDAVHSIADRSPEHIINELARHARAVGEPRRLFLIAENEEQDVSFLRDVGAGGLDAVWNEDWHHAAFVAMTGKNEAYCSDYDGTASEFAAMARWNLLYQGQWYAWQKQGRGTDARACPASAFVCFLENHDQVANTGRGERLHQLSDSARWRAMVALLLLGPQIPMLFQGQECATTSPFAYFADHEGDLADAVRKGRLEFLSQFPSLAAPETQDVLPDPADEATFRACKINWCGDPVRPGSGQAGSEEARLLHTDLLSLRRSDVVLSGLGTRATQVAASAPAPDVVLLRYSAGDDERLLLVNIGRRVTLKMNDPLLAPASRQQRWAMTWCSERTVYGGAGVAEQSPAGPWTLQGNCASLFRPEPRSVRLQPDPDPNQDS